MDQMEENTGYNLVYPFHIKHDEVKGNCTFNKEMGVYHRHYFHETLKVAYLEPFAFFLTEDDMKFYSAQEIAFIDKVIACERNKLDSGFQLMSFNLDEKTLAFIEDYKQKNNVTTEEAVNAILCKIVEEYKANATP